eukprot:2625810-Pyramimonas_sp.AAC.1
MDVRALDMVEAATAAAVSAAVAAAVVAIVPAKARPQSASLAVRPTQAPLMALADVGSTKVAAPPSPPPGSWSSPQATPSAPSAARTRSRSRGRCAGGIVDDHNDLQEPPTVWLGANVNSRGKDQKEKKDTKEKREKKNKKEGKEARLMD